MKAGARAIGVAESYTGSRGQQTTPDEEERPDPKSTIAGVVVRADRVVDGFAFGSCTVGGTDATEAVVRLLSSLDRDDVQYVILAGIAPAWFNIIDLFEVHAAVDRPVLSTSFGPSPGLESALRREFDDDDHRVRLEVYRRQPTRSRLVVNAEPIFLRTVGIELADARDVIRAFTPEGGRPEPLRVARLAARAVDRASDHGFGAN